MSEKLLKGNRITSWCGAVAIALGLLGLLGWVTGLTALSALAPSYKAIAPSAIATLLLLGAIELLLPQVKPHLRAWLAAVAGLIALFGLLELVGLFTSADLNLEDAATRWLSRGTSLPFQPMSPAAGALMFLVGTALVLLHLEARPSPAQERFGAAGAVFGAAAAVAGLIFVLGYVYRAPLLSHAGVIPIAATSALGHGLLGLGAVALAGTHHWPLRPLVGDSTRARLLRLFVPLSALAVLLTAILFPLLGDLSHLNSALLASFLATACAVVTALVASHVAQRAGGHIDQARLEQEVRAQVAEQLTAEINHRMKNNLTLIAGVLEMQLSSADDRVAEELRVAISRISSLSAVHEHLYEGRSGHVELRDVLHRVGHIATHVLASREVDFSVCGEPQYVSSKLGSTLALLANEIITNALKHGAPAPDGRLHVTVSLTCPDEGLCLRIWNSGNPIAADFDPARDAHMGLRLVQGVVESQLRGRLSLTPVEGGTCVEVTLSRAALAHGTPALTTR